jgi:5-methylcytosine-specific restriction endonuclease McrA
MKSAAERKWIIPEERDRLSKSEIKELFLRQDGLCPLCGQQLQHKGHLPVQFIDEHMTPLWKGGSNALHNRALLCKPCALDKTSAEAGQRAKGNRAFEKQVLGLKKKKRRPMMGSKDSPYKAKIGGGWEKR